MELGLFVKHFVKNARKKKAPQENILEVFLLENLKSMFCPMDCRPCKWKEKHYTLSQIIWNFPFSGEVPHESGVSGYSTFVYFP